ncbi:MAG: type II toxin-antitoxin system HicA family toxin [Nitrospirae bacterium]|nr:type II toxin-antitoxin system HicA family toxin [Nitrospirota bacterium]MBF0618117.1 type II toxin-antitoxin system HicA family toxin [Nitrospirota bacterium]
MCVKDTEFLKILNKYGWTLKKIEGSHHILEKGKELISVPVHKRDFKKGLFHKLLKETGLTLEDMKKPKKREKI